MKKVLFFPPAYVSEKPILLDMPDTAAAALVAAGAGAYPLDLGGNIPAPVVPVPTMAFAIPSMSVVEGDSGTKTVTNTINVIRNGASGALTVTFLYTGTATNGTDFSGPSSVIIPANASSIQHSIVVNGDVAVEADETVVISAALSGFVATAGAIVTIMNDDVTTQPSPMVAWTPDMISTLELYDASVAGSMLNAAGTQAQPGEGVATWNSQTSNGRQAVQATAAAQPLLGVDADRSPTNVRPLTMRGSQVMPTNVNSAMDRYTIFAVMRLKAGITGSKYLIGNDDGGVYNLLQSAASSAGALRPLIAAQTFETDTTERYRSFTQNMQVAGVSFSRIQGREESLNTTGSGSGLASGKRFFLGSNSSNSAGGLVDFFSFALVNATVSRANQQRLEGYLAHRAGLASQVLEPTHPYYSTPAMVPAGTTTTLDWIESPPTVGAQQTFMGGYIELQPDSFYDADISPATDGTTEPWGFPQSLIASEQTRLANALFPAGKPMFMYIRLPLGFAYRGLRNIDPTTGLAKNIGQRYAGQNTAIANMIANAVALGGGLMPEYWSPPPYWKTTSRFGKGSLWAGGTYARDVTLASIRTTDATQFNAQIDLLTSAMVDDLEYLHQNVAPVRGFGLQNEAIQTTVDREYGTCRYDASEYGAVLRSIIPKIRNSAILSTYNGQANTVLLNGESFRGFDNAGVTYSNSTVLSTGKTTLQETWAQTFHEISAIAPNPDHIRTQSWAWIASGRGKPTFVNEIEFFEPHLFTDAQRFSRACSWQLHNLNLLGAPVVMPFIHIMKDIDVVGKAGNAKGYALTKMRLPAANGGTDPAANGDPEPTIDFGKFDFVYPNWHAAKFVLENLPIGSVITKVDLPQGVTRVAAVGTTVGGKRRIFIVNWDNDPKTLMTTLGGGGTYSVSVYTATVAGASAGTVSGGTQPMTFQPNTAYVLTEA